MLTRPQVFHITPKSDCAVPPFIQPGALKLRELKDWLVPSGLG